VLIHEDERVPPITVVGTHTDEVPRRRRKETFAAIGKYFEALDTFFLNGPFFVSCAKGDNIRLETPKLNANRELRDSLGVLARDRKYFPPVPYFMRWFNKSLWRLRRMKGVR